MEYSGCKDLLRRRSLYWRRPEINSDTYTKGWFCSGDLGYVDEDGYLCVVDRKQDLIITGGQNIYPIETEEVIYTHPAVAMAAIIGVPDEIKGELAKAYIVLKEGCSSTEADIIEYVRNKIGFFGKILTFCQQIFILKETSEWFRPAMRWVETKSNSDWSLECPPAGDWGFP